MTQAGGIDNLAPMKPFRDRKWLTAGTAILSLASCGGSSEPDSNGASAPSDSPRPAWFVDSTSDLGLDFAVTTGPIDDLALPRSMGGGVAIFDYDGDGRLDLYFVNGGSELTGSGSSVNQLFRQTESGRYVDGG